MFLSIEVGRFDALTRIGHVAVSSILKKGKKIVAQVTFVGYN